MRADAERNRAKVIATAMEAFAADGLTVSVAEIARRAGVGTGTVSRHFPTKESLYAAIVLAKVSEIVGEARTMASLPPGEAFTAYLAYMVEQAAANRGLAEVLAGGGFDIESAVDDTNQGLAEIEQELLSRAQEAGAIRPDVTPTEVKALINACVSVPHHARMIAIVTAGLRP